MKKNDVVVLILFACFCSVFIYSQIKYAGEITPPERDIKFLAFLEVGPKIFEICKFPHDGKVYIKVVGKVEKPLLALPSGPPVYIFDESGILVDWCGDIGDCPSFAEKWSGFSNETPISAEETKQMVSGYLPVVRMEIKEIMVEDDKRLAIELVFFNESNVPFSIREELLYRVVQAVQFSIPEDPPCFIGISPLETISAPVPEKEAYKLSLSSFGRKSTTLAYLGRMNRRIYQDLKAEYTIEKEEIDIKYPSGECGKAILRGKGMVVIKVNEKEQKDRKISYRKCNLPNYLPKTNDLAKRIGFDIAFSGVTNVFYEEGILEVHFKNKTGQKKIVSSDGIDFKISLPGKMLEEYVLGNWQKISSDTERKGRFWKNTLWQRTLFPFEEVKWILQEDEIYVANDGHSSKEKTLLSVFSADKMRMMIKPKIFFQASGIYGKAPKEISPFFAFTDVEITGKKCWV